MDDNYQCRTCDGEQGNCECPAEGYECGECGYEPTWKELQRGTCRGCYEARMAAEKELTDVEESKHHG